MQMTYGLYSTGFRKMQSEEELEAKTPLRTETLPQSLLNQLIA